MNNKKKNARPSHSGRPVSVKKARSEPVPKEKKEKRRKRRTGRTHSGLRKVISCIVVIFVVMAVVAMGAACFKMWQEGYWGSDTEQNTEDTVREATSTGGVEQWQKEGAPYIDVELLTPNPYSRPQLPIEQVNYIAIHYTANPGATAMNNRNYFENLSQTGENKVSSHFVVGLEGEVIQCIPTSEMSYATNSRNVDTISIECCHPDEAGKFNDATYDSAVKLTAWLCTRFGLDVDQVIRHYDVTGKECPRYYVDNPEAWLQMKADIQEQIADDYVLQENLSES